MAIRLTQYARGGGCACKIPPGELEDAVTRLLPEHKPADLLIGAEHGDDAAVVQVSPTRAVVATVDFFTPVVDDARTFGRIAAANALSDVRHRRHRPRICAVHRRRARSSAERSHSGRQQA